MKFKIGNKVQIINYARFYTDVDGISGIPKTLMIHGNMVPGVNHNATIIDIYKEYYIVNFTNEVNKEMQLGFKEDNLKLISTDTMEEDLTGRWLKAKRDNVRGTSIKTGAYAFVNEKDYFLYRHPNPLRGAYTVGSDFDEDFELMPKGFVPPTETKAVESPKTDDLVEEAKRRYPVGCKAKCFVTRKFYEITEDVTFLADPDGNVYSYLKGELYHNHRSDGNWAEVELPKTVSEKWEPKVGDWVVITELDAEKLGYENSGNNSTEYRKNDVVQLRRKTSYGWTADRNCCWWYTSQDSINGIVSVLFRKAEPHEIPKTEEPKSKPMNEYTAEEALAELKRMGFKKGVKYTRMYSDGTYCEGDELIATKDPENKGHYIDCGGGFLWSQDNSSHLHRGPISTNPCAEIVIPKLEEGRSRYDWFSPPAFQAGIYYQAKHDDTPNYLDPASLLPKTKLPI